LRRVVNEPFDIVLRGQRQGPNAAVEPAPARCTLKLLKSMYFGYNLIPRLKRNAAARAWNGHFAARAAAAFTGPQGLAMEFVRRGRCRRETIMNKPQTKQDGQEAAKQVYRELVTINGKNVVLAHNEPPVINAGVLEYGEIFRMLNIFDEKFSPTNIDKADGTPLRLYTSDRVKVDVSKRRKRDMGFWHRNIDAHEIIFCVKGALKWETEMGVKVMHPGDMLFIPKGIGHRSMLCADSTDDNVLIELKIADDLTYVGENAK
jgi:hypothetical protein